VTDIKTLSNFSFNDLLPSSIKDAAKLKAASECLDRLFSGFDERVKLMLVYSRVDELNNQQLDDLAWQWNIGYYEGYLFAKTLEDKRALIKHSIQLHWYKGTRWALEGVPTLLGMPALVIEWFNAGLLGMQMNPYEFSIAIDTSIHSLSPTIHHDIKELVNNLKNVRSYLRNVIMMAAWNVTAYFATTGQGIHAGRVLPMLRKSGSITINYGRALFGMSIVVYKVKPKSWTSGDVIVKNYKLIGSYSATTGRVNPKLLTEIKITVSNGKMLNGYSATKCRVNPKIWYNKKAIIKKTRGIGIYAATFGRVNPSIAA